MKNICIENSYSIWDPRIMYVEITNGCRATYDIGLADMLLNRSYKGMYIEWWLHNIGYYITLPFIKQEDIKRLNERFKHVDLEEHF